MILSQGTKILHAASAAKKKKNTGQRNYFQLKNSRNPLKEKIMK